MTDDKRPAVPQDVKDKFREALERKSAAQHPGGDSEQNTGAVHGSETSGPTQRTFRRKSG
ncbi:hypothetical protein ATL41_0600 [Flavimobilis soli]|uniref:DUF5302 domain-containing protein n=1 Tax=Flavimobilis soli TaxID=442709 RepID=A0A2A9ECF5_9MICO|nr:DUF5302 domain-containing protein [Flavimobilis soli]PFG35900.1 hypothetical protein ATL41_0600 [Flavimobilis soli]